MTLDELAAPLPWGLHDAYLEALNVDWLNARLLLTVRLMMSEHQDMDQRARITISGLVYCAIDPPVIDPERGYEAIPPGGLQVGDGPGVAGDGVDRFPKTPEGCFVHWFFVQQWNRFIHVCGRDAQLTWPEPEPVRARAESRARFPGEDIPGPT